MTSSVVMHGDCLELMPMLGESSVDSIVTDPPYGLSFMGKDWDHGVPGVHFWQEALKVMKPGGYLLAFGGSRTLRKNHHPTVKPTDLMRYLCRLVTPPGGLVLDPFTGSGSTGKAAVLEGFGFIGCELQEEYVAIAQARIEAAAK